MDYARPAEAPTPTPVAEPGFGEGLGPAEDLFAKVREQLVAYLDEARSEADVAQELGVQKTQASIWLKTLVTDGAVEKLSKPVRYRPRHAAHAGSGSGDGFNPAEALFTSVSELLLPYLDDPRTEAHIAERFDVRRYQARSWLHRLLTEGAIKRLSKPVRHQATGAAHSTPFFPETVCTE